MKFRSASETSDLWLRRLAAVVLLALGPGTLGCNSSSGSKDAGDEDPPIEEGAAIGGTCPAVPCFRAALGSCALALPCTYRQNGEILDVCYANGVRASVRTSGADGGAGSVTTVTRRAPDGKTCLVTEWNNPAGTVAYTNGAGQPIASGVVDRSDATTRSGRITLTCNASTYDVDPSGCAGASIVNCAEGSCP